MNKSSSLRDVFGLFLPLYLPACLFAFSSSLLAPVLPLFAQELETSLGLVGLALAAESIGMLASDIPAGMVMRRLGQKGAMTAGLVLNGLSTALIFWAPTLAWVILLRLVAGVGTALFSVSRHYFISEMAPLSCRGQVTSLYGGFMRGGRMLGPVVGGLIAASLGMRASFLSFGVGCLMALLIVIFFLPSVEIDTPAGKQPRGAQLNRIDLRGSHLVVMLKEHGKTFATAGLGFLFLQLIRSGPSIIIPLYGNNVLRLDLGTIGLVMSAGSALDMILFYPAGLMMDRWGRKSTIVPTALLLAVGVAAVPLSWDTGSLVAAAMIAGLGGGLGSGAMLTIGSDLAPRHGRGEFLAVWTLIGDLGGTAGPLLVGALAQGLPLLAAGWAVAAAGFIAAGIFAWRVPETLQKRPAT